MYENLGEILAGDDIENSPYELYMDRFETCKMLCRKKYDAKEVASFKEKIDEEYSVNWVVDNLPAATVVELPGYQEDVVYEHGYYLGTYYFLHMKMRESNAFSHIQQQVDISTRTERVR